MYSFIILRFWPGLGIFYFFFFKQKTDYGLRISDWSSDLCSSDLGLPTKTEQADLFQAVWGRNGECPAIVVAPATPGDCFHVAIEAVRLAFKYMSPVFYLSDGYLANGAEPWAIPSLESDRRRDVLVKRVDVVGELGGGGIIK